MWLRLRRVHWLSWLAGGIVASALFLLPLQPPYVYFVTAFVRPGFIVPLDLLLIAEPFAVVVSTIYVVECPIGRIVTRRQFSLKGFLLAVAAISLVLSYLVQQYRFYQVFEPFSHLALPPLLFAPWLIRIPLLFGVFCLAYAISEGAWWGLCKATRFMTSNWDCRQGPDNR